MMAQKKEGITETMDSVKPRSTTVSEVLEIKNIKIPAYQRPYKWKEKNVIQLLTDINENKNKKTKTYRIGTIIFHKENDECNIVDGQQRLVTITLILHLLNHSDLPLIKNKFSHEDSKNNIKYNYQAIEKWFESLSDKDDYKSYLLNNCEFVIIELTDISEAFQLFDSQNARGKPIEPFDLLKAFHLREMDHNTEDEKLRCVKEWESLIYKGILGNIIGDYIYRIRKWSRGENAVFFTKDDIDEFKGINLNTYKDYPYLKPYIIADSITSQTEANPIMYCYAKDIYYPFQINQMIINGKRFFEYVSYYANLYNNLFSKNDSDFYSFYENHALYKNCYRTGDCYVRDMFKAIILIYYDKFGENNFKDLYKVFFCWAYYLRLKQGVRYASIDKYIREDNNMFKRINNSYHPYQLYDLRKSIHNIDELEKNREIVFSIPEVEAVFKEIQ